MNGDSWTHRESRSRNQICQGNPQFDFQSIWASVSARVECEHEHEHIVIIDSLSDLHENGCNTDDLTIFSNTTALGLHVEIRQ